jgi:hypothetical protein
MRDTGHIASSPAARLSAWARIAGRSAAAAACGRLENATGSGTLAGMITLGTGGANARYEVNGTLSH